MDKHGARLEDMDVHDILGFVAAARMQLLPPLDEFLSAPEPSLS